MTDVTAIPAARKPFPESIWLDVAAVALTIPAVLWLDPWIRPLLAGRIGSSSGEIFGAMLGLHGTLLGFVLAALTIVLGYLNRKQFQSLRDSKQIPNLARIYMASIRVHGIGVVLALLGVVYQTGGRFQALLAWGTLLVAILAAVRLMRVLWATSLIVKHA